MPTDKVDELLEFGSSFDWITPVCAGIRDLLSGGSHTFLIPHGLEWTGREIERALNSAGIKSWGHMIVEDTIMVTVKNRDARRAADVLAGSIGE